MATSGIFTLLTDDAYEAEQRRHSCIKKSLNDLTPEQKEKVCCVISSALHDENVESSLGVYVDELLDIVQLQKYINQNKTHWYCCGMSRYKKMFDVFVWDYLKYLKKCNQVLLCTALASEDVAKTNLAYLPLNIYFDRNILQEIFHYV